MAAVSVKRSIFVSLLFLGMLMKLKQRKSNNYLRKKINYNTKINLSLLDQCVAPSFSHTNEHEHLKFWGVTIQIKPLWQNFSKVLSAPKDFTKRNLIFTPEFCLWVSLEDDANHPQPPHYWILNPYC